MSSRAYFLKNGFIIRSSSKVFKPKKDERMLVIEDDVAKTLRWVPKRFDEKNTKTLYSHPVGFPYSRIGEENILDSDSYDLPTMNPRETKVPYLLSKILEEIKNKNNIPQEIQESYDLLQESLQKKYQKADLWGRILYPGIEEEAITLTAGQGFSVSVVEDGEIKVTFDEPFLNSSSYSLWVSMETEDTKYTVEHTNEEECMIYLKDAEGSPLTEATFSILVRGRLQ